MTNGTKIRRTKRALARREALANRLEPPQGHQRRTRSKRPKQEEDL